MRLSVWGILILALVGSVNSLPANGHASAAPASVTLTGRPVGDPYYLNVRRSTAYCIPFERGGTRRSVPGSPHQPDAEMHKGKQHVRKAENVRKRCRIR